ncbi:MAG: hypothetical protein K0S32_2759 [Bacteroidetes bacterium]|jgi:hypothetical protein|nr:hypothetical protein [Bacteroidota bacterium]
MKIKILVPGIILASILVSCGGGSSEKRNSVRESAAYKQKHLEDSLRDVKLSIPVEIAFENYTEDSLKNRTVIFEAYVKTPLLFYTSDKKKETYFDLWLRPLQIRGTPEHISGSIKIGNGENNTMVELKDKYAESDLVITDNNGQKIMSGDKVKVTGVATHRFKCSKIEKIEDTGYDYTKAGAIEVTPANAKDKSLDKKLIYSEGVIEVPGFGFVIGNQFNINLLSKGNKEPVKLRVIVGNKASQMEDLPKNYKKSDIKFHDNKNNILKPGQKVRIYGVMTNGYVDVEHIEASK